MADGEQQGQGGLKFPKVGTLVAGLAVFIAMYALFGGVAGCFNEVTKLEFLQGIPPASLFSHAGRNACSIAFMTTGIQLAGWFLGLAGTLFDYTLLALVVSMGSLIGKGSVLANGIALGWSVLRDFVNLAFIGALIYAAISLILRLNNGRVGDLIVKVLVAALLVNFSYFFGAVVIDASNFISLKIYQEGIYGGETVPFQNLNPLTSGITGAKSAFDSAGQFSLSAPVSERFMVVTRLGSLYALKTADFAEGGVFADNVMYPYIISFVGVFLFSLTAGVFMTAALFLLIRFAIVIILMVSSPLGILYFTGIQPFAAWGKAWWDTLFAQALFPIVFLVLVATSFKVMEVGFVQNVAGDKTFFDLITNPDSLEAIYANANLILVFGIAWFLMYFSLRAASNVAQQQKFTPPSAAAFFAGTQQFGQKAAGFLYPRSVLQKTGTFAARKTGSLAGAALMTFPGARRTVRAVQDIPGAVGDRLTGWARSPEEKVARETKRLRKARLLDLVKSDIDTVDPEKRKSMIEDWEKAPEDERNEIIRENPNYRDNIAKIQAASKSSTSGTKETKETKGEKTSTEKETRGGDTTTTSASAANRRIETALQSVEEAIRTGNQKEFEALRTLSGNELTQTVLARRELINDSNNVRKLVEAVGKDVFDETLLQLPVEQISTRVADSVGGQIGKLQTYSTLRKRLAAPERDALDQAVERDNPDMRRLYNSSPGGIF